MAHFLGAGGATDFLRKLSADPSGDAAAAFPKEAAAKEAKEAAKRRTRSYSRSNDRFGKVDDGAFWRGSDAGEKIGLDPQMDSGSFKKIGSRK